MSDTQPSSSPAPQSYPGAPQQPVYYAQPVYVAAPPRGKSTVSMVLGIVSVFFGFTLVLPLIGFILGLTGLKSEPAGRGMAIAGIILNGLMLLGWVVVGLIILAVVVLGIGAGVSSSVSP